ncbi:MAG: L-threonylcarbamoyladenylate synthase [Candidatus Sumerlaeota bacterium]|nr:L-threonylcarbamoyladenylate synthase [Candidatus Sumerlaeota bacterium]
MPTNSHHGPNGRHGSHVARRDPALPKRPIQLEYLCPVDAQTPDPAILEAASDTLLNGGIIALPTDTVYGIGADAANAKAVARLYNLKGRAETKSIPLLIADLKIMRHLTPLDDDDAFALLNLFWPGPLTAIVPKFPGSFMAAAPGDTLGLRMPNHAVALGLIRALRRPLAVTSANLSGQPAATAAAQIRDAFGERLDLILDAGPTPGPVASTVLDMTRRPYRIMREGMITLAQLRETLGDDQVTMA